MAVNSNKKLVVFKRDGFKCVVCEGTSYLTVDHIIPRSRGGTDELDNLQTMCEDCNLKKGHQMTGNLRKKWRRLMEFFTSLFPVSRLRFVKNRQEMLGAMQSKDTILEKKILLNVDVRIGNIKPKLTEIIKEHVANLEKNALLKVTGFNNSLEAYSKRGEERDKHLMKIVKLLCDKVEELEDRINCG